MKKLLALIALGMSAAAGMAQTAILYSQTYGTTNGGTTLAAVGWSQILPTSGYSGIYTESTAHDGTTAQALPSHTLYFGGTAGIGIFYTTNGAGSGTGGDSAYTSIDPTLYTNLEISVECQWSYQGGNLANWFAVQVGGSWYVATNQPLVSAQHSASPTFYKFAITYNPAATNWYVLTNTTVVGVGGPAPANLSGPITGIGIVSSLAAAGSWDYNYFLIRSISNTVVQPPTIGAAPLSQTSYAGAGVSFGVSANGTGPFTYQWQSNGVSLANGGRISGATNAILTITNINLGDLGAVYSVIVSNSAGVFDTSTNSTASLTVNAVPADYLYAETFPFVGPLATGYPINVIGWSNGIPDGPDRLYQTTGGDGAAYAYEGYVWTQIFYTTTLSDRGLSGLPFPSINPAAYPAITFSVDINPSYQPANVSAYFAVQLGGANWYVSKTPIPVNTGGTGFATYQQQYDSSAIQWNTLTVNATSATVGSQPGSDLSGNITGAGLVFVTASSGGSLDFDNFLITTNTAPPIAPTIVYAPLGQTVFAGGGASFAVTAVGTQPVSYYWQSNQVPLVDGGRFSGTASNVLTILNVDPNDQAIYSVIVSNVAGTDDSLNYTISGLIVSNVPAGVMYAETLPYVGPATSSDFPLSLVGWANAIPDNPSRLYQNSGGDGAAYSYEGSGPQSTAFYTTTALDSGASGLAFPSINTTLYGGISFWVDLAPSLNPANVTTYFAVQMNGGSWFVSATAIPVTGLQTNAFTTYSQAFNPAAGNWKTLTLGGSSAIIGGMASGNLSGNITGVGLVTSFTGAGTVNFDNLYITTTTGVSAPGGILVNGITGNGKYLSLSWIGSANIRLQSTTNLAPAVWQDVPNTTGQNAYTATNTVPNMFYRLIWP